MVCVSLQLPLVLTWFSYTCTLAVTSQRRGSYADAAESDGGRARYNPRQAGWKSRSEPSPLLVQIPNVEIRGESGDAFYSRSAIILTDPEKIQDILSRPESRDTDIVEEFIPLAYPPDFNLYDVNRDDVITIDEVIGVTGDAENVQESFDATDANRDGYVTKTEFDQFPWGYDDADDVILTDP